MGLQTGELRRMISVVALITYVQCLVSLCTAYVRNVVALDAQIAHCLGTRLKSELSILQFPFRPWSQISLEDGIEVTA